MSAPIFVKPDVPGTKLTFIGQALTSVPPSFADTVAVLDTADWGPMGFDAPGSDKVSGGPQLLDQYPAYEGLYGSNDTPGRTSVLGAFAGQGGDVGGAGGVLFYRLGTGAVRASVVVAKTGGAAALTLTARYCGTRGNDISYVVEPDPNVLANDRLRILIGGADTGQRWSYARTDIAALVAAINASKSPYVTATLTLSGTALVPTAGTTLAGGPNGDAPDATAYENALDAIQFKAWSILAPGNLTDSSILAQINSWVLGQEAANRPVQLVIGGAAGETLADAITRSASLNNPHVVNFGVGTYHDDLLDKDLSTAQLAPRIAGILAARGEEKALTYAEIPGLSIAAGGVPADSLRAAIDGGVTVLMQASMPNAELRIAQGVTTFTSTDQPGRPYEVFSEPRFIRIMDIFTRGMKEWGDDIVIGDLGVDDDTRALVRKELSNRVRDLLSRRLIEPGDPSRNIDAPYWDAPVSNDPALRDAVPFTFGWQFIRTANYVIGNGTVK